MSARFRIVPVTREKLTRAIETKNELYDLYQSGKKPAEEKYALADGINFILTTNFSTHTPNFNHLTKENNLFQKIFKNSSLRSSLNSFKEEWNPADAGGRMEKFKPGFLKIHVAPSHISESEKLEAFASLEFFTRSRVFCFVL